MKTLVIHPEDPTTTFLSKIYETINDKTIITGRITQPELRKLINEHDRTICCGHGTRRGLLSVGQFYNIGSYIIDDSMVELFYHQPENLYIWCEADQYVNKHKLNGFHTGMFISELSEAHDYNFFDVEWDVIRESNNRFSSIVGEYIAEPLEVLYNQLICDYGFLAQTNPIARFNIERLHWKSFVENDYENVNY